jgi:hypothetical protein
MLETLLAGAMALAQPLEAEPFNATIAFVANPYIEKISCSGRTGTGFKLDTGVWVSVAHVTGLGGCSVDGIPIIVTYTDERGDFSTFIVPGDKRRGGLKADCSGYQNGHWYHGQGHARGLPTLTSVPVLYSALLNQRPHERGWAMLAYNRFIPGQSGGPSLNQRGEVTGTVNAFGIYFPFSLSRPLKDTIICSQPSAQT